MLEDRDFRWMPRLLHLSIRRQEEANDRDPAVLPDGDNTCIYLFAVRRNLTGRASR
jgi:hypothetical protein